MLFCCWVFWRSVIVLWGSCSCTLLFCWLRLHRIWTHIWLNFLWWSRWSFYWLRNRRRCLWTDWFWCSWSTVCVFLWGFRWDSVGWWVWVGIFSIVFECFYRITSLCGRGWCFWRSWGASIGRDWLRCGLFWWWGRSSGILWNYASGLGCRPVGCRNCRWGW